MKRLLFLLVLLLVIGVSLSGCNPKDITGKVAFRNPVVTCKNVKVPYTVIEEYEVPLKYEVTDKGYEGHFKSFNYYTKGWVTVRNLDTDTGAFSVSMTFETLDDGEREFEIGERYIMPGETVTFEQLYDTGFTEDVNVRYSVNPGTKTKTRTVTKYKTEERCE